MRRAFASPQRAASFATLARSPRPLRRVLLAFAVVVLVACAGLMVFAWQWYQRPLPLPRSPFEFEVRSGATLAAVAAQFRDAGILPHTAPLVALARVRGVDRAIKAGNYEVEQGTNLLQLLDKLTQGDVTQSSFTIVEGTTFADLRRLLKEHAQVAKVVIDLPDAQMLARLGIAERSPEGVFFPDTYFFAAGSSDEVLLKRAHRLQEARLAAAWARRAPDLPLTNPYDALILASLVEKETGRTADRPLIASVFVNRLKRGMRLQTDPSVIYGMGSAFDGNLRKHDLEADNPYNTYTREGLPPTPIAFPSQASLDAVLNPPATAYLYFVARGDGSSEFSTTLADHNRAVAKYQRVAR
jgi:UPF0755 protein